jgi:hypothetical protein
MNSISSIVLSKDDLFKLYFVDKKSRLECARYFNVNGRTIINNFDLHGWVFRSRSEAFKERRHSEVTKQQIALAQTGKKYSREVNLSKGRLGRLSANKGKTKENNESIRRMSLILAARNKFNYLPHKLLSERRSKENKTNSKRVRKQAESNFVKPTKDCKRFLLDVLNKYESINLTYLFTLAKGNKFREKNVERSFEILKLEQPHLIKSKIKDHHVEAKLEDEIILPFLRRCFSGMEIKRQVKMKLLNGKNGFADIVVFDNDNLHLIVESKVFIRRHRRQLSQLKQYLQPTDCHYGLLTNGFRYLWYHYDRCLDELKLVYDGSEAPPMIKCEARSCFTESQTL